VTRYLSDRQHKALASESLTFRKPLTSRLPLAMLDRTPAILGAVFLISFLVLFLGMSRLPNIFDEGIVLTAAMRVASGQLPHRDFYSLYGPAPFYVLAGLFRVFGESLLVERLFDLFAKASVVTCVYAIAAAYCRKSTALYTALIALLWHFGLNQWPGSTVIEVCIVNLAAAILAVRLISDKITTKRALALGVTAGAAALLRYDTGIALLVLHVAVATIAAHRGATRFSSRAHAFASFIWPYSVGFLLLTLPAFLYYLSVAHLAPLLHDMIVYPFKYYHRGRNLPFPGVHLHMIEDLAVYPPVAIAVISIGIAVVTYFRTGSETLQSRPPVKGSAPDWRNFAFVFGLLTLGMYMKGLVRVSPFQMYVAIIPSLLLIAVLFEHRSVLVRPVRIAIVALMWFSIVPVASLDVHWLKSLYFNGVTVPGHILALARGKVSSEESAWCKSENPLTRGFCFLAEEERIDTIEFIRSHTTPDQRIYVGLDRHDKIFLNDNIIYFATQRLPATKWSELDPDLESRYDVQTQMIQEFEMSTPPYIVLDSEFGWSQEANDSTRSSGVTLLDDYIRHKYEKLEAFGQLSIWRRSESPF
jgi:Dolichyl-phosphate-mannose-protein mannosyltransferase